MQINKIQQNNYTFTGKVTPFTKFHNLFTNSGRTANKVINKVKKGNSNRIIFNQTRDTNDIINLSYKQKYSDNGILERKYKISELGIFEKETIFTSFLSLYKNSYKVIEKLKENFKPDRQFPPLKKIESILLENTSTQRVEEFAEKISYIDGPVKLKVISYADRISEFPSTKLGGSVHPSIAVKTVNENGDVLYQEIHKIH